MLLCCCVISASSFAQLRIGLAGGGHQASVIEENNLPNWETIKDNYTGRTGLHLGFIADLQLGARSNFYFQPGALLYNKGRKYAESFDSNISDTISISGRQFVNYIEVPLNLVYKIRLGKSTKFIIGAGPYVSFFYSAKQKREIFAKDDGYSIEEDNDPGVGDGPAKYTVFDYGVNGLAGFEFGRVFITANYSQGLNDFYQPKEYTATDYKHRVIGATLGVFLGKPIMPEKKDRDGDGVADKDDKCPDTPGSVAFMGCPDTDGDGIADKNDTCPGEAGPLANNGCPYRDKDGDGVLDKDDACVDIAGPVENKGCPWPDSDKDGIADKDDNCPQQAGVERYKGCPVPDTDGDGVNDEEDKCVSVPGKKENNGCPVEVKREIVEKVSYAAKKIQFSVNKAVLTPGSKTVLNDVAAILQQNPELLLAIEGHTSDDGTRAFNMKLSRQRADAVRTYILSKGIAAERLTATGYGPDQPVNTSKTAAARAQNRRVELKLSNQ